MLAELEQDVKSRSASNQATISLAEEKRNKAKLAMDQAQGNIDKMRVTSPMDGLVSLEKNEGAMGGFCSSAECRCRNIAKATRWNPARSVGQVIDPKGMELVAKVGELERNNIKEGQRSTSSSMRCPADTFHGTVKTVGGNNTRRFWEDDTSAKFEVTITLSDTRPAAAAGIDGANLHSMAIRERVCSTCLARRCS